MVAETVRGKAWIANALASLMAGADSRVIAKHIQTALAQVSDDISHMSDDSGVGANQEAASERATRALFEDQNNMLEGHQQFEHEGTLHHVTRLHIVINHHIGEYDRPDNDFPGSCLYQDQFFDSSNVFEVDDSLELFVSQSLNTAGIDDSLTNAEKNAMLQSAKPMVWLTPDDPVERTHDDDTMGNSIRDMLGLSLQPEDSDLIPGRNIPELCLIAYEALEEDEKQIVKRPSVLASAECGNEGRFKSRIEGKSPPRYGETLDLRKLKDSSEICDGLREVISVPIPVTNSTLQSARAGGVVSSQYRSHRQEAEEDVQYCEHLLSDAALELALHKLISMIEA